MAEIRLAQSPICFLLMSTCWKTFVGLLRMPHMTVALLFYAEIRQHVSENSIHSKQDCPWNLLKMSVPIFESEYGTL